MSFDNKEKQKRYRLKKKLIEEGNKLFREWEYEKPIGLLQSAFCLISNE